METVVFFATAAVALASAITTITHRNPVVSVMALVVTLFCVAVNFAQLGAHFLAAAQVLIYAGAILVLFLFVVMLLNAPMVLSVEERRPLQTGLGVAAALAAGTAGVFFLSRLTLPPPAELPDSSIQVFGHLLMGTYLFAFEAITVVLLAAMVGALVLVKRKV